VTFDRGIAHVSVQQLHVVYDAMASSSYFCETQIEQAVSSLGLPTDQAMVLGRVLKAYTMLKWATVMGWPAWSRRF
jgi:hypothetical protein